MARGSSRKFHDLARLDPGVPAPAPGAHGAILASEKSPISMSEAAPAPSPTRAAGSGSWRGTARLRSPAAGGREFASIGADEGIHEDERGDTAARRASASSRRWPDPSPSAEASTLTKSPICRPIRGSASLQGGADLSFLPGDSGRARRARATGSPCRYLYRRPSTRTSTRS
jgi:hypothetical protein